MYCILFNLTLSYSPQWDRHPSASTDPLRWGLPSVSNNIPMSCQVFVAFRLVSLPPSCTGRRGDRRRRCPLLPADIQGGFPVRSELRGEPPGQHHHWEGPLRGGDAPASLPDQAAHGCDASAAAGTRLRAQSTHRDQLRDQEQRRAHPEELHLGCGGKNNFYSNSYLHRKGSISARSDII